MRARCAPLPSTRGVASCACDAPEHDPLLLRMSTRRPRAVPKSWLIRSAVSWGHCGHDHR
eukprot:9083437-Pyramimonas_sp.AAC.1